MKKSTKWFLLFLASFLILEKTLERTLERSLERSLERRVVEAVNPKPTQRSVNQSEINQGEVNQSEVKLMTFNLENLFDTENDPKKNDETFLPLSKKKQASVRKKCLSAAKPHWVKQCLYTNWTNLKVKKKMRRLGLVINAYKPDILFVQEVENIQILKELNQKHLGFKKVILLEGEDLRGIDVGLLTNLKLLKNASIHSQKTTKWNKETRGILKASLILPDGEPLHLYAVHFPSQASPTKARENGLEVLFSLSKDESGLKIAAGDFNITKEEEKENLYKKTISKSWMISHEIGCSKCKGTYYYHPKRSWSFFDVFLFSKNFNMHSTWRIDLESIKIFNPLNLQNTKHKTPARFLEGEHRFGVSDHWPLVAIIKRKEK